MGKKKKKIVLLINDLRRVGGAERLAVEIANSLAASNDVTVLTLFRDDARAPELSGNVSHVQMSLRTFIRWVKCLIRADVKYIHLFPGLYLSALVPGYKVFHEHNTSNRRRKYKLLKPIERLLYRRYSKVICISDSTKASLENWLGFAENLEVVNNFSNIPLMFPAQREKIWREREFQNVRLGMAGSFSKQKDQQFLVDALRCREECVELHFIGGNEQDYEKYRGMAWVHCWKDSSRIEEFYEYIDIYVHAAHWEGFGLTVVEAARKSLPLCVVDVPGVAEVVKNRKMLFEKHDAVNFLEKLDDIMSSYGECSEYSFWEVGRKFEKGPFLKRILGVLGFE
ncbi:glycosyltransferase family 4 protein [Teredinibacter turnerae]|uniref:glycosyltransferase family 4 protein n=1 Tax=Teredinibacter turnerae TaxID=2426 RepID=UPI000429ECCD|nr:glycosyltransferase family 4 protein [Teredinibacter turnerae]